MRRKEIDTYFITKKSEKDCKKVLEKAIKIGLDFKLEKATKKPVLDYKSTEKIMKDLLQPIPENPSNFDSILKEFSGKILDGSMNFSSPGFIAFPDCGNASSAMVGHILSGMLNQNLINSQRCAPTATFVEITVINWLRELAGYEVIKDPKDIFDVGGINVTGGVLANTVGMLLAREDKLPGTLKNGFSIPSANLKVFVPIGINHYSIKAALGWIGLGHDSLIEVKTTTDFTIDQNDLIEKLKGLKPEEIPLALVAYAGDSRTQAIDDFVGLSKIAKKYGLWFHIDACHGFSLVFSDKLKGKIKGIELADSVTIDPHKVLFTPYNLSYILVKNPEKFKMVAGVSDLITRENYSFGQITPFLGSRAFNSLKLWFLMKHLGRKKIGEFIEMRHELAKKFGEMIEAESDFYLFNRVIINSVVFLYVPEKLKQELDLATDKATVINKINELNRSIHSRLFAEGNYYIHTFLLNDFMNALKTTNNSIFQVLRIMLGNPLTTEETLAGLLKDIRRIAKQESLNLFKTTNKESYDVTGISSTTKKAENVLRPRI